MIEISDDRARMDLERIDGWLPKAYWADGIPRETDARAIERSVCVGAFIDGVQVEFTRALHEPLGFHALAHPDRHMEITGRVSTWRTALRAAARVKFLRLVVRPWYPSPTLQAMRIASRPIIAAAAIALSACTLQAPVGPAVDITATTFAAALGINLSAMTKTATGLYYQDTQVGTGTTAVATNHVTVHYTGYLANGSTFDSSVGKAPFGFTLGAGQVIKGWDEGVAGMKVGGTRKLVIPPSLGYGSIANGAIPASSVLVFTVQLISIP